LTCQRWPCFLEILSDLCGILMNSHSCIQQVC
jgi:hypothetical protein